MPAQFIVVARQAQQKANKPKKATPQPGGDSGSEETIYPPPIWIPIGTMSIFGQEPMQIGHFNTVGGLLEFVHSWKKLPGGSNTVFATVGNLHDLKIPSVHNRLAALPNELTIIVHEGETVV
jgi:hypothetical protein